jgi:hypothetical protein
LELQDVVANSTFRALCILFLLIKFRVDASFYEKGVSRLSVDLQNTWIYTLAGSRPNGQGSWVKEALKLELFFKSSRGTTPKGKLFPYVKYFPHLLPLENIHIYEDSLNNLIPHAKLAI